MTIEQLGEITIDHDDELYCIKLSMLMNVDSSPAKFDSAFKVYNKNEGVMCILDVINQVARAENRQDQSLRVIQTLESLTQSYQSAELQVQNLKVTHKAIVDDKHTLVTLLDATYQVDAASILYQFPELHDSEQDFILQGIAVRGANSETLLQVQIQDTLTGEFYKLSELDAQAKVSFKVLRETYKSGQTVCQGLAQGVWRSDICLTELDVQSESVTCTCSLTQGATVLSFRDDMSLEQGETVQFPEVPVVPKLKGTSMFLVGLITFLCFFSAIGSLIAWQYDRKDWSDINNLSGWKLDVVQNVASKLVQPLERVKLRQADITSYSANAQPALVLITQRTHPLLAPFSSFSATQTRLSRFTAYMTQINLYIAALALYFGSQYREHDQMRQEVFLDSQDVEKIELAAVIGAFALLPSVSSLMAYLSQGKVQLSEDRIKPVRSSLLLRSIHALVFLASQSVVVALTCVVCQ